MILRDVAVGSRVRIYVKTNIPSLYKTDQTVDAWVVAGLKAHPNTYSDRFLLGWKPGEDTSFGWLIADQYSLNMLPTDRSLITGYERAYWALQEALVESVLTSNSRSAPVVSQGMFCRGCRNWSPYAAPNRASGNFVCWSCKQGFVPQDY